MAVGEKNTGSYRPLARLLHWGMAVLIGYQLVAGVIMTYEGPEGNVWERISGTLHLYDTHKVLGLVLLGLVLVRLAYRVRVGAPEDEATLATWQVEVSHLTHGWIYLLLIAVPTLGWIGISLYPATQVFRAIHLPSIMAADKPTSEVIFKVHAVAAFVLAGLIGMHVGAALFHHFIRRDGVLRRMLPGLPARDA